MSKMTKHFCAYIKGLVILSSNYLVSTTLPIMHTHGNVCRFVYIKRTKTKEHPTNQKIALSGMSLVTLL